MEWSWTCEEFDICFKSLLDYSNTEIGPKGQSKVLKEQLNHHQGIFQWHGTFIFWILNFTRNQMKEAWEKPLPRYRLTSRSVFWPSFRATRKSALSIRLDRITWERDLLGRVQDNDVLPYFSSSLISTTVNKWTLGELPHGQWRSWIIRTQRH